jgi:hypothetical protein
MAKNSLGRSALFYKYIQFKENIKSKLPNVIITTEKIKYTVDNFIDLYKSYGFLILFLVWLLSIIVFNNYIFITCVFLAISILTIINKFINFKIEQFYLTTSFENVNKELDALITECIIEYMTMNGYDGDSFISMKQEDRIRTEIVNMVTAKISDNLILKLSTYYNKKIVYEIIATRVYTTIMQFVVTNNVDKNSSNNQNLTQLFNFIQ